MERQTMTEAEEWLAAIDAQYPRTLTPTPITLAWLEWDTAAQDHGMGSTAEVAAWCDLYNASTACEEKDAAGVKRVPGRNVMWLGCPERRWVEVVL